MLRAGAGQKPDLDRAASRPTASGCSFVRWSGWIARRRPRPSSRYLDGSRFSADQIHFVTLIVEELTTNGVMEPSRLFEPPYTDHAPTGPDYFFPDADVELIVETLHEIRDHARPTSAA